MRSTVTATQGHGRANGPPWTAKGSWSSVPPCVTFRRVAVSLRGPGQSPVLPFACCVGCCVLSAAAAAARAGVISAFAEPRGWCAGAVLVAAGAVCALAVPSSWRTGGCAGCCGVQLTVFAAHAPPVAHNLVRCVPVCVRPRCPTPPHVEPAVHPLRSTTLWVARATRSSMVAGSVRFAGGVRSAMVDVGGVCACVVSGVMHGGRAVVLGSAHPGFVGGSFPSPPSGKRFVNLLNLSFSVCASHVPGGGEKKVCGGGGVVRAPLTVWRRFGKQESGTE